MGADREPGDTTTCRTPPSSRTSTAIRAAARARSSASGASGLPSPGVSGVGSFNEVTNPVCHPSTPHHLLPQSTTRPITSCPKPPHTPSPPPPNHHAPSPPAPHPPTPHPLLPQSTTRPIPSCPKPPHAPSPPAPNHHTPHHLLP